MKLFLKNSTYASEHYSCNVWINDSEAEVYDLNDKDELAIDIPQGSDVKVEVQNTYLKSNKKIFLMFLYWILSLFSGSGEYMPFGKPFDAVVRIEKADKENIYIQTNAIKSKRPFCVKTDGNIVENEFISPKGYKSSWVLGYALPVFLLISVITLVVLLVEFQESFYVIKEMFLVISVVCGIGWAVYTLNILKK
ncbi:MAG: hypothetical protein ACLRLD_04145 [Lachnospira sp.]